MIDVNEIREAMRGSLALALNRPEGLNRFGVTFNAFWRSFQVILYVLPVYLVQSALATPDTDIGGAVLAIFVDPLLTIGRSILMIVEWLSFPALMIFLSRLLGVSARYGLYITVNNWSSLLIVGFLLPVNILWTLNVVNQTASFFFSLLVMIFVIRYRWFIAITVLKVPAITAAGLVMIDVLISFVFAAISYRLLETT